MIGGLVSLAALGFQAALPCILVLIVLEPLFFRLTKWERTARRRAGVIVLFLALLFGGLAVWTAHPAVYCPAEYQAAFTPEKRDRAVYYARRSAGFFFPFRITVLEVRDYGGVSIEIKYLLVDGTMNMDYDEVDGYSPVITKQFY